MDWTWTGLLSLAHFAKWNRQWKRLGYVVIKSEAHERPKNNNLYIKARESTKKPFRTLFIINDLDCCCGIKWVMILMRRSLRRHCGIFFYLLFNARCLLLSFFAALVMMRRNKKSFAITRCRLFCYIRRPSKFYSKFFFFILIDNKTPLNEVSGEARAPNTTHMTPKRSIKSLNIISIHQSLFYSRQSV